jgi:formylglycine-generating enzyme required for sulfatase activity
MGVNPSWFSEKGEGKGKVGGINTSTFPVENVTWYDAIDFCNRLSKKDGLAPYYDLAEVVRVKGSIASAKVKIVGGDGYRLPTEAEWEVACRDWTMTPFHFGATATGRLANLQPAPGAGGYGGAPNWQPLNRTASVGSYPPSSRGLYDMHGNVEEWCWDWYDKDYYENSPRGDPSGPAKGTHKVVRGGSWIVNERSARTACRFWRRPGEFAYFGGFRVARGP